jgi:hypothetical protein
MTIKPVKFDAHDSSKTRFFGKPVLVAFHFASSGTKVSIARTACPDSASSSKGECRACQNNVPSVERLVATVWEHRHARWAMLIAHPLAFKSAVEQCEKLGVAGEKIAKGQGPDFLLQRTAIGTECQACPETLGAKAGLGAPPTMASVLEQLSKDSHWNSFGTLAELEAKFPREVK